MLRGEINMKIERKKVVVIEMDGVDYEMLLDTLGEASKVRSKIYPSLNEKAALLYGSLTAGEMPVFFSESVPYTIDFAKVEEQIAARLVLHMEEAHAKNE